MASFVPHSFSLTFYVVMINRTKLARAAGAGLVALATFFSLSSGAFVALWIQAALAISGFRHAANPASVVDTGRTRTAAFITVSLLSNRTPFHVFITYLTFNMEASYNRILIWDYGTAEVMRKPIF